MNNEAQIGAADPSFALEKILPGTFVLQGILGGILGGFIYVAATTLRSDKPDLTEVLVVTPLFMFAGAIFGALMATTIWMLPLASGLRMGAGMRVALVINGVGLVALVMIQVAEIYKNHDLAATVFIAMLSGLPTALLVGSRVKPWKLFTFGSIAMVRNGVETRDESENLLSILGTLPLRFLSLATVAVWFLRLACERKINPEVFSFPTWFVISAVYPVFSAYVTFRSPRISVLLINAIGINLPLIFFSAVAYTNYSDVVSLSSLPYDLSILRTAFVLAWIIFLAARLSVQTRGLCHEA